MASMDAWKEPARQWAAPSLLAMSEGDIPNEQHDRACLFLSVRRSYLLHDLEWLALHCR